MFPNFLFKLPKQQNLIRGWKEFYDDTQYPTISYRITRDSPDQVEIGEATNVYIYRCLFTNCSSSSTESKGGVLSFTKTNGKLLIEFSIFEECHSEKIYGGVVYAYGNCECVINNVCSYKCYCNLFGQFIYTSLKNSNKNYVLSSSICSTYEIHAHESPIDLWCGSQKCDKVNISNYNVSSKSAIHYQDANEISNITYCSIVSNHAVGSQCVVLAYSDSLDEYFIESCNIVNNTQQQSNSQGTIYCVEDTYVKHSNLIDNNATYLFYLYSSHNPTVTLKDSYTDHETEKLYTIYYSAIFTTTNLKQDPTKNELEFIDCVRLLNRFRNTSYIYYYIFFLNFLRASLFPSTYI